MSADVRAAAWALISGEYPPRSGGVADYTAQLAAALAAAGDPVHVFAPRTPLAPSPVAGVTVHALPGHFGRRGRRRLQRDLAALAATGDTPRVLIQYVPHAFGRKGMNWGFCGWVWRHRHLQPWVMFHEVAFPTPARGHLRHRLLAWTTQRMAARLHRAAARCFVATPAWGEWLHALAPGGAAPVWLPVPSNLPAAAAESVTALRQQWSAALAQPALTVIGSFCGGVADYTRTSLRQVLPALLAADSARLAVLAGSEGLQVRAAILARAPELEARLIAPGFLTPAATAAHLAACDLLLQPYPDGVSGRRGTAMAALALGVPLLTTAGVYTEAPWRHPGVVALAPAGDDAALVDAASVLLADPASLRQRGALGLDLYCNHFAIGHTVRGLREANTLAAGR